METLYCTVQHSVWTWFSWLRTGSS